MQNLPTLKTRFNKNGSVVLLARGRVVMKVKAGRDWKPHCDAFKAGFYGRETA